MALQPGTILKGQYRIDALIGGGGMALVYRAYDTNLQRVCAIKQNMNTSAEAQRQFHLEAILLAGLNHPHLARVTDHLVDSSGQQYLVMDFVEGENLESHVARNGPVPETKALGWMAGVLDAVAYCHSQGVIHRDIKPANLVKRTGRDVLVLVDFGIAKQHWSGVTMVGARAATPAYAPLEQFTGHTDARSDVYALGATFYFLLTGQEPPDSRLVASGVENVQSLRALNPRISPQTEQAVRRAMALRVGDRPQNVAALGTALAGQQPPPGPKPGQRLTQNRPARASWVALLAVGPLAVVAGLAFAVNQVTSGRPTPTIPPVVINSAASSQISAAPSEQPPAGITPLPVAGPSATSTTIIGTPTSGPTDTPIPTTETPTGSPTPTPIPEPQSATSMPNPRPVFPVLAPSLSSPTDGSELRTSVTLQWSHEGLQMGEQYRVDLRHQYDQPVRTLLLTTVWTSLQVGFDQYPEFFKDDKTMYFWSVVVINANGNVTSARSEEWRFVFKRDVSPSPPPPLPDTPTPQQLTGTPTKLPPPPPTDTATWQPTETPTKPLPPTENAPTPEPTFTPTPSTRSIDYLSSTSTPGCDFIRICPYQGANRD